MSKELVEYLRKPVVLRETAQPFDIMDQLLEKMVEAADEIERLNEIIEDAIDCLSDMTGQYVAAMNSLDSCDWDPEEESEVMAARYMIKAHKVKE